MSLRPKKHAQTTMEIVRTVVAVLALIINVAIAIHLDVIPWP